MNNSYPNAAQQAAAQQWLAQMSDPKQWQSLFNLMQAGMPAMASMPAMPNLPAVPPMTPINAVVPPEKLAQLQTL